jgi:hypothetical protein
MKLSIDITDIKSWPPGTWMRYDNTHAVHTELAKCYGKFVADIAVVTHKSRHIGRGIVVANDGISEIHVIWDDGCTKQHCKYDVKFLNADVIFHDG